MKKIFSLVVVLLFALVLNAGATSWGDVYNYDTDYNITNQGGQGGDGGNADANAAAKAKAKASANAGAVAAAFGIYDFNFDQTLIYERPVMDTVQPTNAPLPLIKGDVWKYEDKMGKLGEAFAYTKPEYLQIDTHRWTFDFFTPLFFRYIRTYDVDRIVNSLYDATEDKAAFGYKVRCYDGSSANGTSSFVGGAGAESTGLLTTTASLVPFGYNRSDTDPTCVIMEYMKSSAVKKVEVTK